MLYIKTNALNVLNYLILSLVRIIFWANIQYKYHDPIREENIQILLPGQLTIPFNQCYLNGFHFDHAEVKRRFAID